MDPSAINTFAGVFALVTGGGLLYGVFRFGLSSGELTTDVTAIKATADRTETKVDEISQRVQKVEQTLHGPDGSNGMYSDVKDLKRRFEDKPSAPKRRRTDRRTA